MENKYSIHPRRLLRILRQVAPWRNTTASNVFLSAHAQTDRVLVEFGHDLVVFSAGNYETAVRRYAQVVNLEYAAPVVVLVDPNEFAQILRMLPATGAVTMTFEHAQGGRLFASFDLGARGTLRVKLSDDENRGQSATQFEKDLLFGKFLWKTATAWQLPAEEIRYLLRVAQFASSEDARPALQVVNLDLRGQNHTCWATDGFQVVKATTWGQQVGIGMNMPARLAEAAAGWIAGDDISLANAIENGAQTVYFRLAGDWGAVYWRHDPTLQTPLEGSEFVMSVKKGTPTLELNPAQAAQALRRARVFSRRTGGMRPTLVTFSPEQITFKTDREELGWDYTTAIPVVNVSRGMPQALALDVERLSALFDCTPGTAATIAIRAANAPIVCNAPDDHGRGMVWALMPMRLG